MAKWIIMFSVTCSECGARENKFIDRCEAVYGLSHYCPNCGAKMDGAIDLEDEVEDYWWGDDDEVYA